MRIAMVIRKCKAAMKDERLQGRKLLLVQYADPHGDVLRVTLPSPWRIRWMPGRATWWC